MNKVAKYLKLCIKIAIIVPIAALQLIFLVMAGFLLGDLMSGTP